MEAQVAGLVNSPNCQIGVSLKVTALNMPCLSDRDNLSSVIKAAGFRGGFEMREVRRDKNPRNLDGLLIGSEGTFMHAPGVQILFAHGEFVRVYHLNCPPRESPHSFREKLMKALDEVELPDDGRDGIVSLPRENRSEAKTEKRGSGKKSRFLRDEVLMRDLLAHIRASANKDWVISRISIRRFLESLGADFCTDNVGHVLSRKGILQRIECARGLYLVSEKFRISGEIPKENAAPASPLAGKIASLEKMSARIPNLEFEVADLTRKLEIATEALNVARKAKEDLDHIANIVKEDDYEVGGM